MSRCIKFRAKRSDNGEWVYGGYYYDEAESEHRIVTPAGIHCVVTQNTLGQYIGLKDNNGNEIYDGDILLYKTGKTPSKPQVVSYTDGSSPNCWSLIHFGMEVENIGNVFDNPELIKA